MKYVTPHLLDTTAIVKLLVKEKGSDEMVRMWQEEAKWFGTTWLCVAEAYGVLKRKFDQGLLTKEEYLGKIYHLTALTTPPGLAVITKFGNERIMLREAEKLIDRYSLDFSDALQLATLTGGIFEGLHDRSTPILVTSDCGMIKAAKGEGITVWDPEMSPPPQEELEG